MRPGSILLVIAFALLASCTTAAHGDHARMLKMSSPNNAVSNKVRLLRSSEIDDNKPLNEEKMLSFSSWLTPLKNVQTSDEVTSKVQNVQKETSEQATLTKVHKLQKETSDEVTLTKGQKLQMEAKLQKERSDEIALKMKRLTSDADINADFNTFKLWYERGIPEDFMNDLNTLHRLFYKGSYDEEKFMNSHHYRHYVTYEKFDKIMKDPSKAPLQSTDEIIEAQKLQKMRSDEVKLMKAQLTSDADIKADFKTYKLWYEEGKTDRDVFDDLKIFSLMRESHRGQGVEHAVTSTKYNQYITYEKFYKKMKEINKAELKQKRSQEVTVMKEQLTSHADIKANFEMYQRWYINGNTVEDALNGLKLGPLQQQYLKEANGLPNFKTNLDFQLYLGYLKFSKIMEGTMPKTAA